MVSKFLIPFLTGSHGDGHPTNTETPLVAWGAGIKHPKPASTSNHCIPTPTEWGLNDIERVDVDQADIAPLMVCTFCFLNYFILFKASSWFSFFIIMLSL